MSFLNALASDGLSVGLRFYNARMNSRVNEIQAEPSVGALEEPGCRVKSEELRPESPKASVASATPEEMAAGRAEARAMLAAEGSLGLLAASRPPESAETESGQAGISAESGEDSANPRDLSEEEKQQVDDLQRRDREVRAHEQAHVAAAAGLAGAPVYEYKTGPDGKRYAVGGHVDVRTSGASDPEVALREAEAVKRAATAPASPSSADRAAAAQAAAQINQIKAEKTAKSGDEQADDAAGSAGSSDEAAGQRPVGEDPGGLLNGLAFSRQVVGAYAAVKLGVTSMAARPVLARA